MELHSLEDGREEDDPTIEWRKIMATLQRFKRPEQVMLLEELPKVKSGHRQIRGELLTPAKPPIKPYDCELHCKICNDMYWPCTASVSDEVAVQTIKSLTGQVKEDMEYLQSAIRSHGDTIIKLWRKKTTKRRKEVLEAAGHDLYPEKWAALHLIRMPTPMDDIDVSKMHRSLGDPVMDEMTDYLLRKFVEQQYGDLVKDHNSKYQDTWLLPYLDVDTLTEDPMRLLSLLYHRTYKPEEWTLYDHPFSRVFRQITSTRARD